MKVFIDGVLTPVCNDVKVVYEGIEYEVATGGRTVCPVELHITLRDESVTSDILEPGNNPNSIGSRLAGPADIVGDMTM